MVVVPELPWSTPRLLGEPERLKLGAWTATVMLVVAVTLPEVPVTVKAVVPDGAELLAVSVSTLVPDVGFVPHDAVTPLGNADVIANVTFPVNPPASVTVKVVELEAPCLMETVLDEARIQKPGTCGPAKLSIKY
jgi:hypothetical protein